MNRMNPIFTKFVKFFKGGSGIIVGVWYWYGWCILCVKFHGGLFYEV